MQNNHHIEQEYKLTAPTGDAGQQVLAAVWELAAIKAAMRPGSLKPACLFHGIYYDTANFALSQRRWSLRARLEGQTFRAALKIGTQIDQRGFLQTEEYEADISGWLNTASELPGSPLKTRLLTVVSASTRLHPRVEVKMQRQRCLLDIDGAEVELSTDSGSIHANNGKSVELNEVELELKAGGAEHIHTLVTALKAELPLTPSTTSKHRLGQGLYA